jgi:hypothetical protein
MDKYVFEKVTPAHYPLLKDLYSDVFNLVISIRDIQKRFELKAADCEYVGFVAIDIETGIAAAHYGVLPATLTFQDQLCMAAQGIDAMTHHKHRMNGLFVKLAKLVLEECRKTSTKFFFSFPNANSYKGFVKNLNWKEIDTIQRLDLKLKIKTIPLAKFCRKFKLLNKIYNSYSKFVLRKILINPPISFDNKYPSEYARALRNKEYLDYKSSPDKFFIEIENHVYWLKLSDILWIGDVSNISSTNISAVQKLKMLAFILGYNTISFHINESVVPLGFLKYFKKYETEPLCVYYLNKSEYPEKILFTGADFDTW